MTGIELKIRTIDNDERYKVGESVHELLVGDPDYINNQIVINLDDDCMVRIYMDNTVSNAKMRMIINNAIYAARNY